MKRKSKPKQLTLDQALQSLKDGADGYATGCPELLALAANGMSVNMIVGDAGFWIVAADVKALEEKAKEQSSLILPNGVE